MLLLIILNMTQQIVLSLALLAGLWDTSRLCQEVFLLVKLLSLLL